MTLRIQTPADMAALPAGVVPIACPVDVAELESQCDARGRPMVLLDTSEASDRSAFMEAVAQALSLPGWFDRTWGVLSGCLSQIPRETVVVWQGWTQLARTAPNEAAVAIDVFSESGLTVLLVDPIAE